MDTQISSKFHAYFLVGNSSFFAVITVMAIMRVITVPITIPIPRAGGRTCREAIPDIGKQVSTLLMCYIISVLLEELKD